MEIREPEVWKPVPDYEGIYEVSSWGNIRNLGGWVNSKGNSSRFNIPKNLKINLCGPYPQICLSKNNTKKTIRIHLIVDLLFLEKVEYDYVINHKDLNKHNNYYKNLERITYRENTSHYFKNNFSKTSIYTGVSYDKSKPKYPWVASFRFEGKNIKVGNFLLEQEAHQAYLNALKEYGLTNKYADKVE